MKMKFTVVLMGALMLQSCALLRSYTPYTVNDDILIESGGVTDYNVFNDQEIYAVRVGEDSVAAEDGPKGSVKIVSSGPPPTITIPAKTPGVVIEKVPGKAITVQFDPAYESGIPFQWDSKGKNCYLVLDSIKVPKYSKEATSGNDPQSIVKRGQTKILKNVFYFEGVYYEVKTGKKSRALFDERNVPNPEPGIRMKGVKVE